MDTGVGIHDLPSFLLWSKLRESQEKPFYIALTHTHFDHSGGVHLFENVIFENKNTPRKPHQISMKKYCNFQMSQCQGIFVHKSESNIIIEGSKYLTVSWITPEEIWPKPKNFTAEHYNVKPVSRNIIQNVDEGHTIDLGNLQIKVKSLSADFQTNFCNFLKF